MSDENVVEGQAEAISAPEPAATVEPVTESKEVTPEVTEQAPESKPEVKMFTQEELDAIVSKRLARAERQRERELAAKAAEEAVKNAPLKDGLKVDQFNSVDEYVQAAAAKKAEELLTFKERQAKEAAEDEERAAIAEAYSQKAVEAKKRYDDFDIVANSVINNKSLSISPPMAEAIYSSEFGPDLVYFLGTNLEEAKRIYKLSPARQAAEIGRIEAKLAIEPPAKKITSAPKPITPVTARTSGAPTYDTTDPKSVSSMSTSEWIEAERQRQIRKLRRA